MEDEAGKLYRFDRVKCPTCDDMSLRAGETDAPDLVRECPDCHGTPLNLWECEAWPSLHFIMPEAEHPTITAAREYARRALEGIGY